MSKTKMYDVVGNVGPLRAGEVVGREGLQGVCPTDADLNRLLSLGVVKVHHEIEGEDDDTQPSANVNVYDKEVITITEHMARINDERKTLAEAERTRVAAEKALEKLEKENAKLQEKLDDTLSTVAALEKELAAAKTDKPSVTSPAPTEPAKPAEAPKPSA